MNTEYPIDIADGSATSALTKTRLQVASNCPTVKPLFKTKRDSDRSPGKGLRLFSEMSLKDSTAAAQLSPSSPSVFITPRRGAPGGCGRPCRPAALPGWPLAGRPGCFPARSKATRRRWRRWRRCTVSGPSRAVHGGRPGP